MKFSLLAQNKFLFQERKYFIVSKSKEYLLKKKDPNVKKMPNFNKQIKVAFFQKVRFVFQISKKNIPKNYPELVKLQKF